MDDGSIATTVFLEARDREMNHPRPKPVMISDLVRLLPRAQSGLWSWTADFLYTTVTSRLCKSFRDYPLRFSSVTKA